MKKQNKLQSGSSQHFHDCTDELYLICPLYTSMGRGGGPEVHGESPSEKVFAFYWRSQNFLNASHPHDQPNKVVWMNNEKATQEKCIYLIIIVVVVVIIIVVIISTAGLRLFVVWTNLFFLLQPCQMHCLLGFAEAPPPNSHTQTQMQWEELFVGYWLQSKGKQIYKRHWFTSAKKIYRKGDTQKILPRQLLSAKAVT